MMNDIFEELQQTFDGAFQRLARELQKIRTGRANPSLLDDVRVEYYGSPSPIPQVASVKVPEPRLITIQPWDKTLLPAIEKAIHASDLGLTPNNDGTLIRLSIPPLTGERRQEFAKQARKHGEEAKISIRGGRKDANDMIKALQKDGDISEDEMHRHTQTVQDHTDKAVARIDEMVARKEKEIMEV